jgi:hypothetical protein
MQWLKVFLFVIATGANKGGNFEIVTTLNFTEAKSPSATSGTFPRNMINR